MNGLKMKLNRTTPNFQCQEYNPSSTDVPDQKDWREEGYVTGIKDQVINIFFLTFINRNFI